MKNKKELYYEEDEIVEVKGKNKFTKGEKVRFIIGIIFLLFIGIWFLVLMYQNVWRPYPEIEGTYYLYHDGINENDKIKISGKKWRYGEEKGDVVYNENGGRIILYIGSYDSENYGGNKYWLKGYIEDGVAYLQDTSKRFYCYCPKDKTPTRDQELGYEIIKFYNYTDATEDDAYCTEITGYGTYYQSEIEIPSKFGDYQGMNGEDVICDVVSISAYAFENCDWITSLTIPDSVIAIGMNAFAGCTGLIKSVDGVLYVDKWVVGVEATCKNAKIREGTVGIVERAFENSQALESVETPDSVRYIGSGAFLGCKNLSSVTLSEGVSIIGEDSFKACTSLKTITIPSTVRFVGGYAFFGSSVEVTDRGSTSKYNRNWNVRESE